MTSEDQKAFDHLVGAVRRLNAAVGQLEHRIFLGESASGSGHAVTRETTRAIDDVLDWAQRAADRSREIRPPIASGR